MNRNVMRDIALKYILSLTTGRRFYPDIFRLTDRQRITIEKFVREKLPLYNDYHNFRVSNGKFVPKRKYLILPLWYKRLERQTEYINRIVTEFLDRIL